MRRMFARLTVLLWLFAMGQPAFAACNGTDLRTNLSDEETAWLNAELAGLPYAEGNHWRATRDGRVLHLIGTMHLSDPRLDAPLARLRDVVLDADMLLLEMTAEDEAALQARLSSDPAMLLLPDTTLPELLPEDVWEKMSAALASRGMPPFMAARFQPWYVSMLLAIPPCALGTDLTEDGLDGLIEGIATDAGIPRRALEDTETIFAAFADQPRDMQINMMLSSLVDPQVSEDLFATLLAAYFDEDTGEGWLVSELLAKRYSPIDPETSASVFGVIEQQLLVDRNRSWIPVLLDAVSEHDTVVAAFGAAHLVGPDGVLSLLAAEGFRLERLPF